MERTRKRSEGFSVDRKVEKKKGEAWLPSTAHTEFAEGNGDSHAVASLSCLSLERVLSTSGCLHGWGLSLQTWGPHFNSSRGSQSPVTEQLAACGPAWAHAVLSPPPRALRGGEAAEAAQ